MSSWWIIPVVATGLAVALAGLAGSRLRLAAAALLGERDALVAIRVDAGEVTVAAREAQRRLAALTARHGAGASGDDR